jgi:hypothetical protein
MSLPAATVWEVRPGAGSDSNGGGFVAGASGTDYSQQNSAQYSGTDLVQSGSTVSSASHSFVSADVGNLINIASGSGFTAGFYQIVSVSAGAATLDRSPGTSGTGGNYAVGGALANLSSVIARVLYSQANGVNGNTVYLKASGTTTLTSTILNYDVLIMTIIGYTSSRTDNGQATITSATNSVNLLTLGNNAATWILRNLKFTHTAATRGVGITGIGNLFYYLVLDNCVFDGCLIAYDGGYPFVFASTAYHFTAINCEFKNATSYGLRFYNLTSVRFVGCFIHNNSGDGININGTGSAGTVELLYSVVRANGGSGIYDFTDGQGNTAPDIAIINSAILANTGDGVKMFGTGSNYGQQLHLQNSIIYGNGGYGLDFAAPLNIVVAPGRNNAFGSNTSGARNNYPTLQGDIALSADPFTNQSAADFTLNNTGGGGADCQAAGFQSTLLG